MYFGNMLATWIRVSGKEYMPCILSAEYFFKHMSFGVFVGELTAFCMGPSKASYCELQDNHNGTFLLKIKAQEPGRHVLQVKYGGEHVNGMKKLILSNF